MYIITWQKFINLHWMPTFLESVKFHLDMPLRILTLSQSPLQRNNWLNRMKTAVISTLQSNISGHSCLPPTVQNCPNRFSDATCSPLFNVVICVMWCSSFNVAYTGVGRPVIGCVSGGCVDDLFSIGGWIDFGLGLVELHFLHPCQVWPLLRPLNKLDTC